jgi:methyl-accepting chemotaxis protein
MNLQNLKISTRLAFGFAVMGLLMAALGTVALLMDRRINDQLTLLMQDRYPKVQQVQVMKDQVSSVARAMSNLFLMPEVAEQRAQFDEIASSGKQIETTIAQLQVDIKSERGKAALAQTVAARGAFVAQRDRMLALFRAGKLDEARVLLLKEARPLQLALMQRLDELSTLQNDLMAESAATVASDVKALNMAVGALLAAALVLGTLLAVTIIRSITVPLEEAARIAKAVAGGDLSQQFRTDGTSETGLLLGALHEMQTRLSGIVGDVRRNADSVATASADIAHGNLDLSSRTEEQASALEQTAASMEQLGSTVRQNADNARQASQLALGASTVAVRGGDVVGKVVETMKGINDSSRRIADIIGVIDGIAFQTNILALNAAVEAARAGEQGRGFAVVASEVRNLAQRSAEAAKEIKVLINDSVERVGQGSALVDQAGETMHEVVTAIKRVTDIVAEISAASTEQSAGVAQVAEAVTHMDQATQQNAALVEESAAAAESLKHRALKLVEAVAVFRTAQGAVVPEAPVPTAAAAAPARPVERRGPNRATNVTRPAFGTGTPTAGVRRATAPTGTDEWTSF